MRIANTIAFAATLLFATSAMAQEDQDADGAAFQGREGDVTLYDFDDDNVDGELLKPEGANLASRARAKHASLIEIRAHFIAELIKLANDV